MITPYDILLENIEKNDQAATVIIERLGELETFKTSSSTEKSGLEEKLNKANESLSETIKRLTNVVKRSTATVVTPVVIPDGKRKTKRRSKKRSKKRS